MAEGAWIFLSHSHKDFDRVRDVRNFLEGEGHHALMFFLKCLGDDDEIDGLIRREIESRSWFILCDSANARTSQWVQAEVEIIKSVKTKTYKEVDLDDPHLDVKSELFSLTRKASVFLSYSQSDRAFAERIRKELKKHDFGVFSDLELPPGADFKAEIESGVKESARRGAVVVLLSAKSVGSNWQQMEVALAAKAVREPTRQAHILPVYLEEFGLLDHAPPAIRRQLMEIQGLDFSKGRFEENMATLMTTLREFEWRA